MRSVDEGVEELNEVAKFLDHESVGWGDDVRQIASEIQNMRDEIPQLRALVKRGETLDAAICDLTLAIDRMSSEGNVVPGFVWESYRRACDVVGLQELSPDGK